MVRCCFGTIKFSRFIVCRATVNCGLLLSTCASGMCFAVFNGVLASIRTGSPRGSLSCQCCVEGVPQNNNV